MSSYLQLGVSYKGVNVLEDDALRQGIKKFSNWPTIPQLYVKGEFIGGCDIVREMHQTGQLERLLRDKSVLPHGQGIPAEHVRERPSTS